MPAPRPSVTDHRRAALLAFVVVGGDLVTKGVAERHLDEPVSLIGGLRLELGHNSGIAFGALDDLPSWILIAGVSVVVGTLLVAVRRALLPVSWGAVGLLLGGALANLVDRAGDGRVTDFIDPPRWPPFNLADVAITSAILLILWHSARDDPPGARAAVDKVVRAP